MRRSLKRRHPQRRVFMGRVEGETSDGALGSQLWLTSAKNKLEARRKIERAKPDRGFEIVRKKKVDVKDVTKEGLSPPPKGKTHLLTYGYHGPGRY